MAQTGDNSPAMIRPWRSLAWRVLLAFGLVAGPWPLVIAAPPAAWVVQEHGHAQLPCHEDAPAAVPVDCCDDAGCVGDACGSALCNLVSGLAPPVVPVAPEPPPPPANGFVVPAAAAPHPPPVQALRPPIA